ncbi:MAG: hypothetical protein KDH20_11900 [Rhodocyclaceae bacterium]|nr:hypothetical protein [Rhodocyclaceae bacterium]MCB1956140.1 hypothetical protein [Rhodocyclaceae bacterium]
MNTTFSKSGLGRSLSKLACLMAALPVLAHAAIVEMDARDFRAATSAAVLMTEDFEGMPAGPMESPVPLANGLIYSSAAPWVLAPAPGFTSLTGDTPLAAPRTFIVTEPGINAFGVDLFMQEADEYDVTVTTAKGSTLRIAARRGDKFESFFGVVVTDDTIQSVTFTAVGGSAGPGADGAGVGNYTFDNATVGTVVATTGKRRGKDRNR